MADNFVTGVFTKTFMDEKTKFLHVVAGELAPDDFDKSGKYKIKAVVDRVKNSRTHTETSPVHCK